MKPVILYREDSDIKDLPEELTAIKKFFDSTPRRTVEELKGNLVIGRYSVLPFYKELEDDLAIFGSKLINSYRQHCYIADVMQWAAHQLGGLTPRTWSFRDFQHLPDDGTAFVLKGQTNSRKFLWDTHMFAPNKSAVSEVYCRLLDDSLLSSQEIYAREYIPLKKHFDSLHGLPITEEFRFFVCCGHLVSGGYYWSNFSDEFPNGAPSYHNVPLDFLEDVISRIDTRATFYALDVAQAEDGRWIVIEINDGQMSGLSDNDPWVLYRNLRKVMDDVYPYWRQLQ